MDVGTVRISLAGLREHLLPAPAAQLEALRALLPRLAGQLLNTFLEQVQDAGSRLRRMPTCVEQYVAKLDFLEQFQVTSWAAGASRQCVHDCMKLAVPRPCGL